MLYLSTHIRYAEEPWLILRHGIIRKLVATESVNLGTRTHSLTGIRVASREGEQEDFIMRKQYLDCHVNTELSGDSILKLDELLRLAPSLGLGAVCPTEHYDPIPTDVMMAGYDHQAAVQRQRRLSGLHPSVQLGLGVEISYRIHGEEQIKHFLKDKEFDMIIGSVHDIRDQYLKEWMSSERDNSPVRKRYAEYFHLLVNAARSALFPVLGHLDYLKKYPPYPPSDELAREFDGELYETCSIQVANGGLIEVNASGFRHEINEPYPSKRILDIYRNAGGRYVTVGSDAHALDHISSALYETVRSYCHSSSLEILHWNQLTNLNDVYRRET